jgi:hypothetical protein
MIAGFLRKCSYISGPRQPSPPPQTRTLACHLPAGRPESKAGHLYGGPGKASDRRSSLWVVEVVVELALMVVLMVAKVALVAADVALVIAELAFVAAEVALVVVFLLRKLS